MPTRLSMLEQRFREDPSAFRRDQLTPVLVWAAPPAPKPKALILGTVANYRREPTTADPLVFPLLKRLKKVDAFPLGVTLGRMSSSDVCLDEASLSRFHCYFQQDPHTQVWHVVDAESFNGTFMDGVRLAPSRPAPLHDRMDLKFGFIEMKYFSPRGLELHFQALPGA